MATIPILNVPTYTPNLKVDDFGLEKLGEAIKQGQIDRMRQDAIKQYAASNDPKALLQPGDLTLANLYGQVAARQEMGRGAELDMAQAAVGAADLQGVA